MLSLLDLDRYYQKMYIELRNYIWDFPTVESLAELEVAVYCRFPELKEIRNRFNSLYSYISKTCLEDEELSTAVKNFKDLINSSDNVYSKLIKPREV